MASTKEFYTFVREQLERAARVHGGTVTARPMMGEYCIYYRDKLIMELCDDQLLIKPTPSVLKLLPGAERAYPYEGSKTLMVVIDRIEDRELVAALMEAAWAELPAPKKNKKSGKKEDTAWNTSV